ncbi:hypothetical protein KJ839_06730 [Patescibacteria group bacterium]|nr:hypothetical protein [Patescibacteria group bacterium]
MKVRIRKTVKLFLANTIPFLLTFSCGSGSRSYDEDGGGLPDTDLDVTGDVDEIYSIPICGNGIREEGEECDDLNRLNNDGCTWDCRNGNGIPTEEADASVSGYQQEGDSTQIGGAASDWQRSICRLPLEWTGAQFATAIAAQQPTIPPEPQSALLSIKRFNADGTLLAEQHSFSEVVHPDSRGFDLVWNGTNFGFFYCDDQALFIVLLDSQGKPLGEPVAIVERPRGFWSPAAAWTGEGWAVVYRIYSERAMVERRCSPLSSGRQVWQIWAVLTGPEGRRDDEQEPRLLVENVEPTISQPDISAGSDSIGVTYLEESTPFNPNCAHRFMLLDRDLTIQATSGVLSNSAGGELTYSSGRFVTAWLHANTRETDSAEICIGRFTDDGELEGPPVCHGRFSSEEVYSPYPVAISSGDMGLGILFRVTILDPNSLYTYIAVLYFQRTDEVGRPIGPAIEITRGPSSEVAIGAYAIEWGDGFFGGIYQHQNTLSGMELRFLRFVPISR